jgi:hypothetical protein
VAGPHAAPPRSRGVAALILTHPPGGVAGDAVQAVVGIAPAAEGQVQADVGLGVIDLHDHPQPQGGVLGQVRPHAPRGVVRQEADPAQIPRYRTHPLATLPEWVSWRCGFIICQM